MPIEDTSSGTDTALAGAHPDLMTTVRRWVEDLPAGATFTAAQIGVYLPGYADDHPSRRGAMIRALLNQGLIEFAGYGPRAVADGWDRPTRVWRRAGKADRG